ncbi:MAG TPA: MscL family protein [Gemmatimonadaceae bacterium]|nr:MscL family protein [Gemmatimonadaceae bacterium]
MWREFKTFLIKQNALALAIAVVIGTALNDVVQALVNDIIMPIVAAMTPSGTWREAAWTVGSVSFGVGHLASVLLNFLIVGFVAWRISKAFFRPEPSATASTKQCQYCKMTIDAGAVRCPHCTSQLVPA